MGKTLFGIVVMLLGGATFFVPVIGQAVGSKMIAVGAGIAVAGGYNKWEKKKEGKDPFEKEKNAVNKITGFVSKKEK